MQRYKSASTIPDTFFDGKKQLVGKATNVQIWPKTPVSEPEQARIDAAEQNNRNGQEMNVFIQFLHYPLAARSKRLFWKNSQTSKRMQGTLVLFNKSELKDKKKQLVEQKNLSG